MRPTIRGREPERAGSHDDAATTGVQMSLQLRLTEEQALLQSTLREVCEQHSDANAVRDLEDDPGGFAPQLWATLTQLGLHGPIQQQSDDAGLPTTGERS